jgi:hypothetical protein
LGSGNVIKKSDFTQVVIYDGLPVRCVCFLNREERKVREGLIDFLSVLCGKFGVPIQPTTL